MHILARTIRMAGAIGADPCSVLGVSVGGAVPTIVEQIAAEQQAETAATLVRLPEERLNARGDAGRDSRCRGGAAHTSRPFHQTISGQSEACALPGAPTRSE